MDQKKVQRAAGKGGAASAGGPPSVPSDPGKNTPGDTGLQRQNTTVQNLEYNESLFGEFRRRKRNGKEIPIRSFKQQATATKPLPPSSFGVASMCLAWHVKGMCNADCRLAADHRSYSPAEYAPLVTWCQACYPAGE
jgi:hypothetical protein